MLLASAQRPSAASSSYNAQSRIVMDIAGKLRPSPMPHNSFGVGVGNTHRNNYQVDGYAVQSDGVACLAPCSTAPGGYVLAKPPSAGLAARRRRITAESISSLGASSSGSAQQQQQVQQQVVGGEGAAERSTMRGSGAPSPSSSASPQSYVSPSPPLAAPDEGKATAQRHEAALFPPSTTGDAAVHAPKSSSAQTSDQLLDEMFGGTTTVTTSRMANTPTPAAVNLYTDPLAAPMPAYGHAPKSSVAPVQASDFDPFASPPREASGGVMGAGPSAASGILGTRAEPIQARTVSGAATQHQWGQQQQQEAQNTKPQKIQVNSIDDLFS